MQLLAAYWKATQSLIDTLDTENGAKNNSRMIKNHLENWTGVDRQACRVVDSDTAYSFLASKMFEESEP